ncbi:unnamed protein product [Clavelina lepadiformis]|uniref:Uncharacterized protein n=1 Tax=Clavelina lepadiformis TaxID=159417 RepID=A0ABP0GD90_CLALP
MVKLHFRELICRRCWKRLYRPCQYSMGLSKRSLPDAENFAKNNQSELKTQVSLRRKRRGIRRMQRFRIRINCRNCRTNCFN